jgi:hypothetical protein
MVRCFVEEVQIFLEETSDSPLTRIFSFPCCGRCSFNVDESNRPDLSNYERETGSSHQQHLVRGHSCWRPFLLCVIVYSLTKQARYLSTKVRNRGMGT